MKTLEELKNTPRLLIKTLAIDGGIGEIHFPHWTGTVVWSFSGGWEHVSIAPYKKHIVPSWDDMCALKNMFFYEEETVVQFHPAKSDYVNIVKNCLHLWRPLKEQLPIPNSLMVGPKPGQSMKELKEFIQEVDRQTIAEMEEK